MLTARLVAVAGSGQACVASMAHDFERAIHEAEALSLHADVVEGFHSLSWLAQQANDIERTREVTIRAETAARKADAATRCRQLANTGRCLLELERDLPRARGVLQEAGDHWREYQCLVWLATMIFERGAYRDVRRLAREIIIDAARKMGDSRASFAEDCWPTSRLLRAGRRHCNGFTITIHALKRWFKRSRINLWRVPTRGYVGLTCRTSWSKGAFRRHSRTRTCPSSKTALRRAANYTASSGYEAWYPSIAGT
ncbi:hypothetical protein [Paraburkholderia sp. SG-MS1]|uniref:hypothetical protein n=1 Tax=Paraburkholderia sp. SG-MS1 TaxID=2023741 RepID=UPI001EEA2CC7|nr:hypothetical protein [Paraburkholderia sp. SG-MS1]